MKRMFVRLGLVLLFFSCATLAIGSQVADVAKKERQRREKVKTPAKVFTNKDIAEFKVKNNITDSETSSSEGESYDTSGEGESDSPYSSDNMAEQEKYWRGRYEDAQTKIEDLESKADGLQKEINKFNLNVSNYDGVVAGPQLTAQLGEMKDQLAALQEEIATAKQEMEDLQEEGRKEGALPGWFRE